MRRLLYTFALCAVILLLGPVRAEKEAERAGFLERRAERDNKEDVGLPEVGKPAPAFDLPATQIEKVLGDAKGEKKTTLSLKDLKGKNVVLFFFPRALTKGCTIESCGFRDRIKKFEEADTAVIGISCDTLAKQKEFTKKEKLNFPLLADEEKKITKAYGVLSPKGTPKRHTFVIDKKGILRKIYTEVTPSGHPDEVLKYIKEKLNEK